MMAGAVKRLAWIAIVAAVVLAVVRGVPANPSMWGEWAQKETTELSADFSEWFSGLSIGKWGSVRLDENGEWTGSGETDTNGSGAGADASPAAGKKK